MIVLRETFDVVHVITQRPNSDFGLPVDCFAYLNLTSEDPTADDGLWCPGLNGTEPDDENGGGGGGQRVRAAIVGVILGFISLATAAGNVLVLVAIFADSLFRNTTHYFIANLAVADLLVGLTVLPFSASLEVLDHWAFGPVLCDLWAAADVLCCTASIFSLCVISVDRYVGVTRPLQHGAIVNETRAGRIIVLVWVVAFTISVAPMFGWREPPPASDPGVCEVTKQTGYVLFSVSGSFYVPLVVILVVYYRVYREATNQSMILEGGMLIARSGDIALRIHFGRTDLSSSSCPEGGTGSTKRGRGSGRGLPVTVAASSSPSPSNSKSLMNKIAKFNREKKAAKTLGIVVGVFIFCWFPFFFVLPLEALCPSCIVPVWLFKIIFWLGYCNSLMNPIIYACSSREFQRAFLRILRCSRLRRRRLLRRHQHQPFLRRTFLALQSVHVASASIATDFGNPGTSRRLAVGVASGSPEALGRRRSEDRTPSPSPVTESPQDIPLHRLR